MLQKAHANRYWRICANISLILCLSLPLLIPFGADKNIEMQGLILIVAGIFAWLSLLPTIGQSLKIIGIFEKSLLFIFILSLILSLVVTPNLGYNFFGAPHIRLGVAGLLACIGCGLLVQRIRHKQLISSLYVLIVGATLISYPYCLIRHVPLTRFGGIFAQPDILGVFLGCGILIGAYMSLQAEYRRFRLYITLSQIILFGSLLLTQTRAAILLVVVLLVFWYTLHNKKISIIHFIGCLVFAGLLLVAGNSLVPSRLKDLSYVSTSANYRLLLQVEALSASWNRPVFGYGPGNLADALDCQRLSASQLQETCSEGYFFNSSHNIYLDRILAFGWIGGLAFLLLVATAVFRGLQGGSKVQIYAFCLMLVALYYFTNVTGIILELLLWIFIFRCLLPVKSSRV